MQIRVSLGALLVYPWLLVLTFWPTRQGPDYRRFYRQHVNEVVAVWPFMKGSDGRWSCHQAHGSGVVIDNDGLILTAGHVAALSALFLVRDSNGASWFAYRDVVSGETDLGLLREVGIRMAGSAAKLGKRSDIGESVVHIGFPMSMLSAATAGIVSVVGDYTVVSDAVIAPGSSGGALYNTDGKVIGIAEATLQWQDDPSDQPTPTGYFRFIGINQINRFVGNRIDE